MLSDKSIDKLDLLETALMCDVVEWKWDTKEKKLYGFYSEESSGYPLPLVTAFWISEDEDGRWIYARDYWPDGDVRTMASRICQARVA